MDSKIEADVSRRVTVFAEFDEVGIIESHQLGTQTSKKDLSRTSRILDEYLRPTEPSASNYNSVVQNGNIMMASADSGSQIPIPEQPPVPELAPQPVRPLLMSTHSEAQFGSITSLSAARQ